MGWRKLVGIGVGVTVLLAGMLVLTLILWGDQIRSSLIGLVGSSISHSQVSAGNPVPQENLKLPDQYQDLALIDVHNHDAWFYRRSMKTWEQYGVDKVALFGNVSEPSAIKSDKLTWQAYKRYPDKIFPFFSGFDMYNPEGVEMVRSRLEQGYMGIGETYAASSYTAISSKLKWKAKHPMDGNLPQVYELCAQYHVPILLHIDPPRGNPITKLKEALGTYPDTIFIFAHANVFNQSFQIELLLREHPNLYIDFMPGFTTYNPRSPYKTESYIELIEKYPDRFFLSTDSAFDMTYEQAIIAMYEVIDQLTPATREKVASLNFQKLMDNQPPTNWQLERFKKLSKKSGKQADPSELTKHELSKLLFELER